VKTHAKEAGLRRVCHHNRENVRRKPRDGAV
jgi:hypothetical protein